MKTSKRYATVVLASFLGAAILSGVAAACPGSSHATPPGLAKKSNGCMPPGHAKRYNRGDRWRSTYGDRYTYNRIPYDLRQRYDLNSRSRYYYNDGYLYQVDPRTMVVQQVISALLR